MQGSESATARRRLVDVVENRSSRAVSEWLRSKPGPWLDGIAAVALDPYRGYSFLRRGMSAVDSEWKLITATHNLLKLWRLGLATA